MAPVLVSLKELLAGRSKGLLQATVANTSQHEPSCPIAKLRQIRGVNTGKQRRMRNLPRLCIGKLGLIDPQRSFLTCSSPVNLSLLQPARMCGTTNAFDQC